jgi:ParB-like chromosome segregation protein Spo0J
MKISDKIKIVKLKDITPYPSNIKIHTKKQIMFVKELIEKNSYLNPISVDKKNVIVAGHCRYAAMCEIDPKKETEIEVIDLSFLPPNQIKKIRIQDNTSAEADIDYEKFELEINDIYKDMENEFNEIEIEQELGLEDGTVEKIKKVNKKKKKLDKPANKRDPKNSKVKHKYICKKCESELVCPNGCE